MVGLRLEEAMDTPKVAVTLVCAADDKDELDDVDDGLSAAGREVALISGVDKDPRLVGEAIDSGEFGLVVAITSSRLDPAALRKVEGLFSARRGPNHAMVHVDVGGSPSEIIAAIQRAIEAFVSSHGRVVRRTTREGDNLREVVSGIDSLALPAVRLPAGEEIEGDTRRIHLADSPKAAELSRRRKAARERERERERITRSHEALSQTRDEIADARGVSDAEMRRDEARLDRMMVAMIIGAGVLAVLAALTFSGVF